MTDSHAPRASGRLESPDWQLVRRLPLFEGLESGMLERLLEPGRVVCPGRGDQLFARGQRAAWFYVVLVGWVKIFRTTAEGRESVVHVFTRGESFAEAAIFAGGDYPVSASAATPARLLAVPADPFLAILEEEPRVACNMLAAMSRHLRELVTALEQLQAHSASQRLATFLLGLVSSDHEAADLHLPIDKGLIAARLGMKPETLSRALAALREEGLEISGERVHVPDVGHLRWIAGHTGDSAAP
ncbi:Crp/Fnr family transcriptional regulator [Halofilum ochraceum]|uniref:Crp/Fnr family transcriptional regulator n=1 Tax=Halofilum ochraceum TaxID=1611323 RepID=UPI0008DA325F|nr:Crp/Fnr family transcriptional regulator [Halofilum ochraceum]